MTSCYYIGKVQQIKNRVNEGIAVTINTTSVTNVSQLNT